MSGEKNIFSYINTEGKRTGKLTALDYFQKNTGVFNGSGMIPPGEIAEMKKRAQTGEKNLWHGFISFSEEESHKIDNPRKCIELVKRNFGQFFKDMGFDPKNIDLMCALHLDRPTHLHVHFLFYEKEPKQKYREKQLQYRRKGKIDKSVIDKMHLRLNMYIDDEKNCLRPTIDEALSELKKLSAFRTIFSIDDAKKEIIALAKALPVNSGKLNYNSFETKPYRERIDKIINFMLHNDKATMEADRKFYTELEKLKQRIKVICNGQSGNRSKIDEKNITLVSDIEADYRRRQGNLVLGIAKFIKPEIYRYRRKHTVNDNTLKKRIAISNRRVDSLFKRFISSFGMEIRLLERDFSHRLQDIEKEMEEQKQEEQEKARRSYWTK